jgi:enoyl-CoA hydratase/carnithine racemase
MPEVQVGVPSVVEAALLPHLIGFGKTRELVLRGNLIDAQEAYRIGLVEQLVDTDALDAAIAAAVNDILTAAPNAIRLQKSLCREWEHLSPQGAIDAGLRAFAAAYSTDEPRTYCQRFFDKKKRN